MNNKDILDNAPEGATHIDSESDYYKIDENVTEVMLNSLWYSGEDTLMLSDDIRSLSDIKRIAELEQYYQMVVYAGFIMEDSEGVAGYHLNGDVADWDSLFTYSLYKEAVAKRDLEQQRKGFWLGFEDARCHPDEMNILNQWENTKVFIEAKGGAE